MQMQQPPRIFERLAIVAISIVLVGCVALFTQKPDEPEATAPERAIAATLTPTLPVNPNYTPASVALALPPGPRMDHPAHIERGVNCDDCHMLGESAAVAGPKMLEACMICHEDLEPEWPAEKRLVGTFFSAAGQPLWQRASTPLGKEVIFDHQRHESMKCAECHGTMAVGERRGGPALTMAKCTDCHRAKNAQNSCATCHNEIREDRRPPSHAGQWQQQHGGVAMAAGGGLPADCRMCHTSESYCTDCHQNTKPASHEQEWVSGHGKLADAASGGIPSDCRMCHTSEAFCSDCHQSTKPASHEQMWVSRHGKVIGAGVTGVPADCRMCHTNDAFCSDCHENEQPPSHDQLWMQRHGDIVMAAGGGVPADCRKCHTSEAFCTTCHKDELPDNHTNLFRTRTHGVMVSLDRTTCMACHENDSCERCHDETPPRNHRGNWAKGRNTHCATCHLPVGGESSCRLCHHDDPVHSTAPDQPSWHEPGFNCRLCHTPSGSQGAPPLRHVDNGLQCNLCHR